MATRGEGPAGPVAHVHRSDAQEFLDKNITADTSLQPGENTSSATGNDSTSEN